MSPGQDPMNILPFAPVYYDKRDHVMKSKDMSRPDDFIEISGSKVCPSPTASEPYCFRALLRLSLTTAPQNDPYLLRFPIPVSPRNGII